MHKTVFMFSGQGSQYYHMANQLFEQDKVFKDWMHELDDLVKQELGESVVTRIYAEDKKKSDPFDEILYTHPAIFMVEYALAQSLAAKEIHPAMVLGASLGELTAAAFTGVMTLPDAVKTVIKQATLYDRSCPPGVMIAVLAPVDLYHDSPLLRSCSEIAGVNGAEHFVLSTLNSNVGKVQDFLNGANVVFQLLPVKQAFHSSYIDPICEPFSRTVCHIVTSPSAVPFVSCLTAGRQEQFDSQYFWDVVRKPIRIADTLRWLEAQDNYHYIDIGPSATFANFARQHINSGSNSLTSPILPLFGSEVKQLSRLVEHFAHLEQ